MSNVTRVQGIKCTYSENKIRITSPYRIALSDTLSFCQQMKSAIPVEYKRSECSWTKEIISYNFMRGAGVVPDYRDDIIINDNEKWWHLLGNNIIYVFYLLYAVFAS